MAASIPFGFSFINKNKGQNSLLQNDFYRASIFIMPNSRTSSSIKKAIHKPAKTKDETIQNQDVKEIELLNDEENQNKNQNPATAYKNKFSNFVTAKSIRILIVLLILSLILAFYSIKISNEKTLNSFKTKIIPEAIKKVSPGLNFTVDNVKEVSGLYEFGLTISGNNASKYTSYMTRDGSILFIQGIKIASLGNTTAQASQNQTAQKKLTCSDLPKTEKPKLTAFVVSNCPYGLQMQRVLKTAINELPQLNSDIEVKYIGDVANNTITSMHGDKEAQENLKQICIRDEQPDRYWAYVNCYMKEGKTDECLTSSGIDTAKLNSCTQDTSRGLKYAKADFDLGKKLGVSGSPTLIVNDNFKVSEFDFGGRNPNAIKDIVACSYTNKPTGYNASLSKNDLAVSFSLTDTAAANSNNTTAAGCGTQ